MLNNIKKVETLNSEKLRNSLIFLITFFFIFAIGFPLISLVIKAFQNHNKEFIGLSNFIEYLESPGVLVSLKNTMCISVSTTVISILIAFLYAYGIARTNIKNKNIFRMAILLPLFAPTMLHGISLIYLFGRKGLITTGFFEQLPFLAIDIKLYGVVGIVISEVIYTLPQVYLILSVALNNSDYRLYEAAKTLGASNLKQFFTITIPSCKYAIFSSVTVAFILAFTDFGAPKVIGGNFNVLATDIYKQVVGQQNLERGAVVSILLMIPAILAFVVEKEISKKQRDVFNGKSTDYRIEKNKLRDRLFSIFCYLILGIIVVIMVTPIIVSFIKRWPYNFGFSLWNYNFYDFNGGVMEFYKNSVKIASFTGIIGMMLAYSSAYFSLKVKGMEVLKRINGFFTIVPMALPGMVLGLSYIFFFNQPYLSVPFIGEVINPFNSLYGTIWILVIVNIVHFFSVAYMTAYTSLKKLDDEFEIISLSMGIQWYKTLFKVTIPLTLNTIGEIFVYYFLNAMTTISAIVFLYTSKSTLLSIAMINLDDTGEQAKAAAMGTLIIFTNIVIKGIYEFLKSKKCKKIFKKIKLREISRMIKRRNV